MMIIKQFMVIGILSGVFILVGCGQNNEKSTESTMEAANGSANGSAKKASSVKEQSSQEVLSCYQHNYMYPFMGDKTVKIYQRADKTLFFVGTEGTGKKERTAELKAKEGPGGSYSFFPLNLKEVELSYTPLKVVGMHMTFPQGLFVMAHETGSLYNCDQESIDLDLK